VETSRPCAKGVGWWKSWGLERWKLSNRQTSREADGLFGEHHCSNHKTERPEAFQLICHGFHGGHWETWVEMHPQHAFAL